MNRNYNMHVKRQTALPIAKKNLRQVNATDDVKKRVNTGASRQLLYNSNTKVICTAHGKPQPMVNSFAPTEGEERTGRAHLASAECRVPRHLSKMVLGKAILVFFKTLLKQGTGFVRCFLGTRAACSYARVSCGRPVPSTTGSFVTSIPK